MPLITAGKQEKYRVAGLLAAVLVAGTQYRVRSDLVRTWYAAKCPILMTDWLSVACDLS